MEERLCILLGEICRNDVSLVGGKGANLGDLVQAGLPIPSGFIISTLAYKQVIEYCHLDTGIEKFLSDLNYESTNQLKGAEQQIRSLFENIPINNHLRHLILERYRSLGPNVRVAVRSSATAEDLTGASFAGQQETMLNVVGEEALLDAVRRCWSSLYTSQAIFYRHQKGFDSFCVSMALVVQTMIDSEKSGVIFTVDPVLCNRFNMIIEAVWGLGEGIVSGVITPDHYKIDRETYEIIHEFVPEKNFMFCQIISHGVTKRDVPPEKVSIRVLTDDELRRLVDMGNKVERHFGYPQDIEWAIEGDTLWLLQSRAITCL